MQNLRVGQNHPKAILTDREVELLRHLRETDPVTWSYGKLAIKFEISKHCVVRICRYRTR